MTTNVESVAFHCDCGNLLTVSDVSKCKECSTQFVNRPFTSRKGVGRGVAQRPNDYDPAFDAAMDEVYRA